jgi:hypothetical protein
VFTSGFVRKLKPGKTYDAFIRAWYPDQGFGITTQGPYVGRNLDDEHEILDHFNFSTDDSVATGRPPGVAEQR